MSRKGRSYLAPTDATNHWRVAQEASFNELSSMARKEITWKTPGQKVYMEELDRKLHTICVGPAGTGKSFLAINKAVKMLKAKQIKKIVLSRPLVQCGKGYGFLPGDIEEKIARYFRPLLDCMADVLSPNEIARYRADETIELLPLEDMRGTTIKDTFVICDEAQNAEYYQLHMLLTRYGPGSRFVICGDTNRTQIDVQSRGPNPLAEVVRRAEGRQLRPDIGIVKLTRADIVRHDLVQWWDETLTEDHKDTNRAEQGSSSWYSLACPKCDSVLWYDNGDESDSGHSDEEGVRCWGCQAGISLWDKKDQFNPHLSKLNANFYSESFKEKGGGLNGGRT